MSVPVSSDGSSRESIPLHSPATSGRASLAPLPQSLTPLVGRDAAAATLAGLLRQADVRLVTLTGPGGVGKTRLALQVAAGVADAFTGGVTFVALAPIADPALVLPAIARALGVREAGDRPLGEHVAHLLANQRRLLVLDNFEQVAEAVGLVAALLAATAELKALVTSRVPLRVGGEHEFAIPPLPVPDAVLASPLDLAANPAVALFVRRPRAVRANFVLTDTNAPAVAEVCRLDGLPLAIELAAAWSMVLSPPALLARLGHRLDVLTGGPRDAPARLPTMRNAIAWSDDLLPSVDQALFHRLAVFAGGVTVEAAEAVAIGADAPKIDGLRGLTSLVDHSLLRQEENADGDPGSACSKRSELLRGALDAPTLAATGAAGRELPREQAIAGALDLLAEPAGPIRPVDVPSGIPLTPRERDVLGLLADGRSDREIAAGLFISPRTAQGHVASIFASFRVGTRTVAVAAARQAGLVIDPTAPK